MQAPDDITAGLMMQTLRQIGSRLRGLRTKFLGREPLDPRLARLAKGTILVIAALIMSAIVGLIGLVLDVGMLVTTHRQSQNAADAGAMAAAFDMLQGKSSSTAAATATTFVQQHNGLNAAVVTINIPPVSGPHAGVVNYAEAIVSSNVATRVMRVVGVPARSTVTGRAVAGWEGTNVAAGVIALDTSARPGLSAVGNGSYRVNGTVYVNSNGGGLDDQGRPINNGNSGSAISLTGNASIYARDVESVGGYTKTGNAGIYNYDPHNPQSPLHTGAPTAPDPFISVPPPTTANGAVATNYGAVRLTGNQTATLNPGVYTSISLSGNAGATFNPGIYVITGGGMSLSGNGNVTGNGVMIYNTGSDYNVNTGLPDSGDGSSSPPAAGNPSFGGVSLSGNGTILFTPYSNPSSPFDGIGFYQRRLNTQDVDITGNGSVGPFKGTIYAKWATMNLTGNGSFAAQFVVASLRLTGNGSITVDATGQNLGKADQVFLVE